jgi:hypothetical protein
MTQVLDDIVEQRPFTGQMHETGKEGDTKIIWDKDNSDEVEIARAAFDSALRKGMLAYAAEGSRGRRGTQIRTFDPDAERIILVRPMQGG